MKKDGCRLQWTRPGIMLFHHPLCFQRYTGNQYPRICRSINLSNCNSHREYFPESQDSLPSPNLAWCGDSVNVGLVSSSSPPETRNWPRTNQQNTTCRPYTRSQRTSKAKEFGGPKAEPTASSLLFDDNWRSFQWFTGRSDIDRSSSLAVSEQ